MHYILFAALLQAPPAAEMADTLRSEGKIYVVILGIMILFVGISLYLYVLDRRLRRFSKKIDELQPPEPKEQPQ